MEPKLNKLKKALNKLYIRDIAGAEREPLRAKELRILGEQVVVESGDCFLETLAVGTRYNVPEGVKYSEDGYIILCYWVAFVVVLYREEESLCDVPGITREQHPQSIFRSDGIDRLGLPKRLELE